MFPKHRLSFLYIESIKCATVWSYTLERMDDFWLKNGCPDSRNRISRLHFIVLEEKGKGAIREMEFHLEILTEHESIYPILHSDNNYCN